MANFQTHITGSTILGISGGCVAYGVYHVPASSSILAAGLCSVSGMLPDIDSGPGRPLHEISCFLAAVVPTILIGHLLKMQMSQETIILTGAAIYVAIRFGLANFLKRYTVHRGMFHSFPTAAIFGELTYLAFYNESMMLRLLMAGAVVAGFLSHLLLDEIYSVQWDGRPRLKRSFGTAMKFYGEGWWPNLTAYAKLLILTFLVIEEPSFVQKIYAGQGNQVVKDIRQDLQDHISGTIPLTRGSAPATTRPADPAPIDNTYPITTPSRQATRDGSDWQFQR